MNYVCLCINSICVCRLHLWIREQSGQPAVFEAEFTASAVYVYSLYECIIPVFNLHCRALDPMEHAVAS